MQAVFASLAVLFTLAAPAETDEFRDLFDGQSLDGWVAEGPVKDKAGRMMWSVNDGRIACLGEGFGFLREVVCAGPRIKVRLNDRTVLEADQSDLADLTSKPSAAPAPKDKPPSGYVALQSHSGRVEFRKVQIREP